MDASLHRSVLAAGAAKDIPAARPSPNEGSALHLRGEIFLLVSKKSRTLSKISIETSILEEK